MPLPDWNVVHHDQKESKISLWPNSFYILLAKAPLRGWKITRTPPWRPPSWMFWSVFGNCQRNFSFDKIPSCIMHKNCHKNQDGSHENVSQSCQFLYLQFYFWSKGRDGMCYNFKGRWFLIATIPGNLYIGIYCRNKSVSCLALETYQAVQTTKDTSNSRRCRSGRLTS